MDSEGTTVLIDPDQPLLLDVSVGEALGAESDSRWQAVAVLLIDGRRVWIHGHGPTSNDALQDLIHAGTELRVEERKRARARLN